MFGLCKSIKNDYNFDFDKNGDPLISECQENEFFMYYAAPEAQTAFANLYDNVNGL
jgi:hypothetical protein